MKEMYEESHGGKGLWQGLRRRRTGAASERRKEGREVRVAGKGIRTKGCTVGARDEEKRLPPAAGRQNIKGNRLLVREVKNRPSPGHTRIAFIYLLEVLYH